MVEFEKDNILDSFFIKLFLIPKNTKYILKLNEINVNFIKKGSILFE